MRRTSGTGRGGGFGQGTSSTSRTNNKPKRNTSILNFFKKSDGPVTCPRTQSRITEFGSSSPSNSQGSGQQNGQQTGQQNGISRRVVKDDGGSLFVEDTTLTGTPSLRSGTPPERQRSKTPDDFWESPSRSGFGNVRDEDRYNENDGYGVKKRKVSHGGEETTLGGNLSTPIEQTKPLNGQKVSRKGQKRHGPFIDESDSEDDIEIIGRDGLPAAVGNTGIPKDSTATVETSSTTNKESSAAISDTVELEEKGGTSIEKLNGVDSEGGDLTLEPGADSRGESDTTKNEILENEVGDEAIQFPADDVDAYDFGRFDMDSCADIPDEETPVCPVCQASLGNITDMVNISPILCFIFL